MRWEDSRYVRLYCADDGDWSVWEWQARALFPLILRACDRVGVVKMGKHGAKGLAALVRLPVEVVEAGLAELLSDGCVTKPRDGILFVRNYISAQEAKQSDKARKAAERERERAKLEAIAIGIVENNSVTKTDEQSEPRTERHDSSQPVTLSRTEPCSSRKKRLAASPSGEPPVSSDHDDEPLDLAAPTRQAYLDAIATASSGRFIASKPTKGNVFKLDAPRKQPDALAVAARVGRWFAAGGDAWRGVLDGRHVGDLDAWIAQSAAWERAGGGPVLRSTPATAQPVRRNGMQGPVEPSDFVGVPAEGRDALATWKG